MKASDYIKTFALVAIMLFFTVQNGYGSLLLFLCFIFLLALLYNAMRMARKPDERKRRGIRMAIWFVALSVAVAVQTNWYSGSSREADRVAKAVLEYRAHSGAYPASLKEVGLDEQHLREKWEVTYFVRDEKPALTYPATFMPLTTYEYDFDKHAWRVNAY